MKDFNKEKIGNILTALEVNSFNRFYVFLKNQHIFTDKEYWYALSDAFQTSDNLYKLRGLVKGSFNVERLNKKYLMSRYERRRLKNLPDKITIYRGMSEKELKSGNFGVSWTLSKKVARFFAEDYMRNYDTRKHKKIVHCVVVDKSSIIAYFSSRKEKEVIYMS